MSYSVSPLVIDTTVLARDIITRDITIQNRGNQIVTVYPTVNNISLSEGGTIDAFLPPVESDRTRSLASWIEIRRLGIDIKPGESTIIPLTLRISPEPVAGTYHAFIGFANGGNRDEAERKVADGGAPGTVITVTIKSEETAFMKLSKFIVSRFVIDNDNHAAVYTFSNPSKEAIVPQGEIILYDSTGKEVGSLPVNVERVKILPGDTQSFTTSIPINGLFGKYKAFLSAEYGTIQKASVYDTSFFYVLPLKTILVIFSVLLILVLCTAWYFHKKYFSDDIDDSERLKVHIRESKSEAKDHDVDLTRI